MSVILFGKDEIVKIAKGLLALDLPMYLSLSDGDQYVIDAIYKGDRNAFYENKVVRFVQRAWAANQMVHLLQYRHHDDVSNKIEILEGLDVEVYGGKYEGQELLRELKSLRYNIFSNDGNYFLSKPDEELLDVFINNIQEVRLRELEVENK
jgi:hypothetical protein